MPVRFLRRRRRLGDRPEPAEKSRRFRRRGEREVEIDLGIWGDDAWEEEIGIPARIEP